MKKEEKTKAKDKEKTKAKAKAKAKPPAGGQTFEKFDKQVGGRCY